MFNFLNEKIILGLKLRTLCIRKGGKNNEICLRERIHSVSELLQKTGVCFSHEKLAAQFCLSLLWCFLSVWLFVCNTFRIQKRQISAGKSHFSSLNSFDKRCVLVLKQRISRKLNYWFYCLFSGIKVNTSAKVLLSNS